MRSLEETRQLLRCGSLEGRAFTADAIALALDLPRDHVIDRIDDNILLDQSRPNGLLEDAGSVTIADERGQRTLWKYRFVTELDWWSVRRDVASGSVPPDLYVKLARALEVLYGAEVARIAWVLERLYATAQNVPDARRYRRMADIGISDTVTLWRARSMLGQADPGARAERRRRSQVMLAAAAILARRGPFREGLEMSQTALRLTILPSDKGEAFHMVGVHHMRLGAYELAITARCAAAEIHSESDDRARAAGSYYQLGVIYAEQGRNDRARQQYLAALEIRRKLGLGIGEASCLAALARLDFALGDYDKARSGAEAALRLQLRLEDRHGEATSRHNLATMAMELKDYRRARAGFLANLDLLA